MGLVLDTSAIVHLERHRLAPAKLPYSDEPLVLPMIVWAEALIGVRLADSPERAGQRRGLLERIRLVTNLEPFSPEAAEIYADLYCQIRKAGKTVPQNDLQVASIGMALGYGILVGPNDESHFRRIENLRVEVLPI